MSENGHPSPRVKYLPENDLIFHICTNKKLFVIAEWCHVRPVVHHALGYDVRVLHTKTRRP